MQEFDVIIIGAGAIGMACGIEAQKAGLRYVIIDKGCLVNSMYHYPINMTFFSTSERLEIGNVPFISHGDKPTRREALDYYRRVATVWKLNLRLYEEVQKIEKNNEFVVRTAKNSYQANYLILATGFYDIPNFLNVKGENLPKVKHYFDEAHPYAFQKVAVIGAANSAVDAALETYRKGADVTMIIRESEIRKSVKYWVKPDIENRIKEGSIKAYFDAKVLEIHPNSLLIEANNKKISIENDFVFAMTGYQPNYELLKNLGIRISEDEKKVPFYDEKTHQTNQENLYLAGVVCGGMETNKWFIENSRYHADNIIAAILAKNV